MNKTQVNTRSAVVEINTDSIIYNLNYFKKKLKSSTKIIAMVKAFSYGLGSIEISKKLSSSVDYLGVAYFGEATELIKNNIKTPIIIFSPEVSDIDKINNYDNLELVVANFDILNEIIFKKTKNPIHIKIDSGMNRFGFVENEITKLIQILKNNKNLQINSIFSHLSCSDNLSEKQFTLSQIKLFESISETIKKELDLSCDCHILNTHGVINYPDYQYDMVRIGIGLYGFSYDIRIQKKLKNTISLKAKISQIKNIKKGGSIGYSRAFIADKNYQIATIFIGHSDGIPRNLNDFKLKINNKPTKILGNICMDSIMVDVSDIDCKPHDWATVFDDNESVEAFAKASNTISYEILTRLSPRLNFIYN